jgi:hypothetical protein
MLITTLLFLRCTGGQASRQQLAPPHSTSSTHTPSANSNNSTPLKPAPPPKPTSLLTSPGGGANTKATQFNRLPLPSAATSAAQSATPFSYSSAKRHQQQQQPGASSGAKQNKSAGLLQQQRLQQSSPRAERKARLGSSGANSPTGGQSPRLTPRHVINGGRTSSTVVSSSSSSNIATTSRLQRPTTTASGARNGAVLSSRLPSPGGINMMATMTPLASGGIESASRGKNNSTPVVGGGASSPKRGHSNNNRLLKAEAHRVLADQLSRGRIAPKAKFRADDEISIGEPSVMVSPRTVSYASEDRDLALPGGRGEEEEDREGPASESPRQQLQPRVVSGGSPDRKYQLEVKQQRQVSTAQQQQVLKQHNSNSVKGAPQRLSLPQPPGSSGVRAATTVGKSASLDNYYNSANSSNSSNNAANKSKIQSAKSSGVTLLQRLSSLRLSFNSHDRRGGNSNSSPYKITPHLTDSDSGFFAGIAAAGGKRRPLAPYEVRHGPNLVVTPLVELHKAPPKRRRPKRRQGCSNGGRNPERSYSFTDAQFIAQAVVEGDTALIEELYPSFPASSDPIYTVIKKNRRARTSLLTAGGDGARTMTAMVRPNFLSDSEARGSSLVHPAERQPMAGEDRSPRASSCATGGRRRAVASQLISQLFLSLMCNFWGCCSRAGKMAGRM